MSDLLPYSSTQQERALSEAVARAGEVPTPIRDVWNPGTCPSTFLPWLAWAFSVDDWDNSWTDAQKRAFIKSSVEVHRHKGTIGAVKDALAALSITARVREWFNQSPEGAPYTFKILLEADQIGIGEDDLASVFDVIERTKNLRSHLDEVELSVRSETGPCLAVAGGVGSEIWLTNYRSPVAVLSETTIIL